MIVRSSTHTGPAAALHPPHPNHGDELARATTSHK
jgi:hypothetical protein